MPGVFYRGLRIMAIDSSTLDMPDEAANAECYGYPPASRGAPAFPKLRSDARPLGERPIAVSALATCDHPPPQPMRMRDDDPAGRTATHYDLSNNRRLHPMNDLDTAADGTDNPVHAPPIKRPVPVQGNHPRAPEPVVRQIHMMTHPPTGMVDMIPWRHPRSPPDEVGPKGEYRGWGPYNSGAARPWSWAAAARGRNKRRCTASRPPTIRNRAHRRHRQNPPPPAGSRH